MAYQADRIPDRFPAGTKLVVEGRPARKGQAPVYSRHLEFPDGTFCPLPSRAPRKIRRRLRRGRD